MTTRLYRVPEVAEILGCGRTTVYGLIKSGELPSLRVAGCRRVSSTDVEDFIAGHRAGRVTMAARVPTSSPLVE